MEKRFLLEIGVDTSPHESRSWNGNRAFQAVGLSHFPFYYLIPKIDSHFEPILDCLLVVGNNSVVILKVLLLILRREASVAVSLRTLWLIPQN